MQLANFCNIVSNVSFKDYVFDARYGIFGNSNCLNSELDTLSIPIIEINEPEYSVKQVIEYIEKHLNVSECIEIFLESEGEEYLLNDDDLLHISNGNNLLPCKSYCTQNKQAKNR